MIDQELLEILCCPKTKVPVEMLSEDKRKALNERRVIRKLTTKHMSITQFEIFEVKPRSQRASCKDEGLFVQRLCRKPSSCRNCDLRLLAFA